jgi:uncharacterized membrane protein YfcA
MHSYILLSAILCIGIVTGFLDSTVGAGGSVSLPSLILIGLSPQLAIVIDRIGSIGQSFTATLKFWRSGKIRWDYLPLFIVVSLAGTYIGTHLLLTINPNLLQKAIGVVLLLVLPVTLIKNELGIKRTTTGALKKAIGSVFLLMLYMLNGLLGVGSGGIAYYSNAYFYGFTFLEANATAVVPWFLLSVFSVALYAHAHVINWQDGLSMLVGMSIGGYIGAHVALKKGERWIKNLLAIVVAVACIRLLTS